MMYSYIYVCRQGVLDYFFFNDTATTEIYTLSLHDALPICTARAFGAQLPPEQYHELRYEDAVGDPDKTLRALFEFLGEEWEPDRKSTRLNSSHANISYAVFCLKKKKTIIPS